MPESASRLNYEGIVYRRIAGLTPAKPVALHAVWREGYDNPALAQVLACLEKQQK